jgi:murein L,D-transpeptidase YcbB/YkuD
MKINQLPLLTALLFLLSCSLQKDKQPVAVLDDPTVSRKEKLIYVLSDENLLKMGFSTEQIPVLQDFYKTRNYQPLWINDSAVTNRGIELRSIIGNSYCFGIPRNRLVPKRHQLKYIEEEVYLTGNISLIYSDLKYGFIDFENKKYKRKSLAEISKLDSLLIANKGDLLDSVLLKVHVSDTNYQFMAKGLYTFAKSVKIDTFNYSFKPEKNDTIAFKKTAKAFVRRGLLADENGDEFNQWRESVKKLQQWHGFSQNGHFDKNTCAALNESNYRKIIRLSIELDKLRLQEKRPKKYVLINIPSFQLNYFSSDTLRAIHRIISGKVTNPTPTLRSKITSIVVYPFWNVPYSIAKDEILPAVKRNVNYLRQNNYRIYSNGKEIDPYQVKWKSIRVGFPYKVVQDPGPKNSLGIIKFEFHNNFSVYVHDTPSKSLFNSDVRAYSHGCMRCQQPVDLGKLILTYDSLPYRPNLYTADSLDTLIQRAKNFPIRLIDPVPIFIEYHTATSSRKGIIIHLDVYKKEEDFIAFMEK